MAQFLKAYSFVKEFGGTIGEMKVADVPQNVAVNVAVNTKFLADSLELNRKTIQRELAWLQKNNLVRWVGADKNGHWETIKKE